MFSPADKISTNEWSADSGYFYDMDTKIDSNVSPKNPYERIPEGHTAHTVYRYTRRNPVGCSEGNATEQEVTPVQEAPATDCPPGVTVALPEADILYRGYDNHIEAVVSGFDSTVVTGNDILLRVAKTANEMPYYIGRVKGDPDIVKLDIAGYNSSTNETAIMGMFVYKVADLPEGQAFLGNFRSGDSFDKTATVFSVRPIAGLPVQPVYTVKSWELHCATGSFSGKGNVLTLAARSGIQNSKKGSPISALITYEATDKIRHIAPLILYR